MVGWALILRTIPWETTSLRGASTARQVRHEAVSVGWCCFEGLLYSRKNKSAVSPLCHIKQTFFSFFNTKNIMNEFTVVVL